MDNKKDFKPFISADKIVPEFTFTSLFIGILLAVVFGAANAYLGLRVGMTVSASIPAAVLSMGIIRVILRRDSILENNMVQTVQLVNRLQPERFLHCLHYSCGQQTVWKELKRLDFLRFS